MCATGQHGRAERRCQERTTDQDDLVLAHLRRRYARASERSSTTGDRENVNRD
jgi:hypothetical protein